MIPSYDIIVFLLLEFLFRAGYLVVIVVVVVVLLLLLLLLLLVLGVAPKAPRFLKIIVRTICWEWGRGWGGSSAAGGASTIAVSDCAGSGSLHPSTMS